MYEVRIRIDTQMLDNTMSKTTISHETVQGLTGGTQSIATAVELGMALAFSRFLRDIGTYMERATPQSCKELSWDEIVMDMWSECLTTLQNAAGDYTRDVLLNDSPPLDPDDNEFIDWNKAFRHLIKGDEA